MNWEDASITLPDANRKVLAWLDGYEFHSDVRWVREGYAFMWRHPNEKTSDANGWAIGPYEQALKDIGAQHLEITHWHYPLGKPEK